MIHLDTNFLIDSLVPGSAQEAQVEGWLVAGESPVDANLGVRNAVKPARLDDHQAEPA